MGKHRTTEQILKAEVLKLKQQLREHEEDHRRDLRVLMHKLQDRQKCNLAMATQIGEIVGLLKSKDMWYAEERRSKSGKKK